MLFSLMSNFDVFIDCLLCVCVLVCVSVGFVVIIIWSILAGLWNAGKIAYKLVLTWLSGVLQRGRHRRVTIVQSTSSNKRQ